MPAIRNYAVLIGVEHALDGALKGPTFASADVRTLKEVIEKLGYLKKDMFVLAGKGSTRSNAYTRLRNLFERVSHEPGNLIFYFGGPAFSSDGKNFLALRDSSSDDHEGTSIDLDWLIREIRRQPFLRVQIYLDFGESDSLDHPDVDLSEIGPFSEDCLEKSLVGTSNIILFCASRSNETSYSSPVSKHGIWAHHLIKVFSGQAPEILAERRFLQAQGLQAYLADHVPRSLRDTFTDRRKKQTPWCIGIREDDFQIADLSPILGNPKTSFSTLGAAVKDFAFRRQERIRIKSLRGFKQGVHHLPKWSSRQAETFVASIAAGEIEEDLSAKFAEIRQNLAYRRRQLEIRPSDEGEASIRTPDFQYGIRVELDEDPSLVLITRELSDIYRPEILADSRLAQTFDAAFDTVWLTFERPIEVEDLIDLAESNRLPVTYPTDCSNCTIKAADGATIRITPTQLDLKYPGTQTLERLTRGLDQVMHLFPRSNALPAPSTGRRT